MDLSFPFLGQGSSYYGNIQVIMICFQNRPSKEAQKTINSGIPTLLMEMVQWDGDFLFTGSSELSASVNTLYGKPSVGARTFPPNKEAWFIFDDEVERWLQDLHAEFPLAFVMRPRFKSKFSSSDWEKLSLGSITSTILPSFKSYLENKKEGNSSERICWMLVRLISFFQQWEGYKKLSIKDIRAWYEVLELALELESDLNSVHSQFLGDLLKKLPKQSAGVLFLGLADIVQAKLLTCDAENPFYFLSCAGVDQQKYTLHLAACLPDNGPVSKAGFLYEMGRNLLHLKHFDSLKDLEAGDADFLANLYAHAVISKGAKPAVFEDLIELETILGNFKGAFEVGKQGLKKYPGNGVIGLQALNAAIHLKRFSWVKKHMDTLLLLPGFNFNTKIVYDVLWQLNHLEHYELAIKLITSSRGASIQISAEMYTLIADVYCKIGKYDRIIDDILLEVESGQVLKDVYISPLFFEYIACLLAKCGNKKRALEHLQKAKEMKHPEFNRLKKLPCFEPIKNDPEFLSLFS